MITRILAALAIALAGAAATNASAVTPTELQAGFAAEARRDDPSFRDFSPQRGEAFYRSSHGGDWSCATCHTDNPRTSGRHAVTKKPVQPLAPAANPERFTDAGKVEKWFRRNCSDVLKRGCTAREKGDLIAWLLTVTPGGNPR